MSISTGKAQLTLEEYIATLKHSSLPTLVVEGKDDLIVYRKLESQEFSILPVSGRDNVLSLFDQSAVITQIKVAFIADKDTWVYTGIPAKYQSDNLFFTTGYSIENDVIVDGNIEEMMSATEKQKFHNELNIFSCWYVVNLNNHLISNCQSFKDHPNVVLDNPEKHVEYLERFNTNDYPAKLFAEIREDYRLKIRGKSLFGLIIRQLSYAGRSPRHNDKALMEMVAIHPNALLDKIKTDIHNFFQ